MSDRRMLLFNRGVDQPDLIDAVQTRNIDCVAINDCFSDVGHLTAIFERSAPFECVALLPLSGNGGIQPVLDISDALSSTFAAIKAAISVFERTGISGRLISMLPAVATMGDPDDIPGSAVAGAMLSLFRTTALELRGTGLSANTLMYRGGSNGLIEGTAGLATIIDSLVRESSTSINGQEIFVADSMDVGRLRP
ncbi:hypothetical protein JS562_23805 [Agrobacterium sp. S2]|nr:hypothetical protein [Agrobacterium sp. S2]